MNIISLVRRSIELTAVNGDMYLMYLWQVLADCNKIWCKRIMLQPKPTGTYFGNLGYD